MKKNKNLIVVRAGDKSLHPQWINDQIRNWDIAVSYFGDYPERYKDQYDFLHLFKGSKWQGLANFVNTHDALLKEYDFIWFPDDDLFVTCEVINEFFILCNELDLTIAQPALTTYSHYSWPITLESKSHFFRLTDFIEIMAPCFKQDRFQLFKNTFSLNSSGWGLEWLWSDIAIKNNILKFGILDQTPVFHTRKVGIAAHGGSTASPQDELDELLKKFNLVMTVPKVLHENLK